MNKPPPRNARETDSTVFKLPASSHASSNPMQLLADRARGGEGVDRE